MQFLSIIILLLLNIERGFCNASFYKEKARGWHWYETKKDEISDKKPRKSPTQMVDEIRNDTETKLHKALIEPTESNIIEYIKAQEKVSDKSEKFARVWQQVIYKNPGLDRTLRYPVSSNALHISRYEELAQKRNKIRSLSKEYGLMYFFRGNCKYCIGFSSVVKNFAKFYDWELMPIQIGDIAIDTFENAKKDNGISITLGIKNVPALIAVHPKSGEIIPLAFSYISESEIEDRVNILIAEK